jgi:pimeloyl-ACP methyl ester carboxylesterase
MMPEVDLGDVTLAYDVQGDGDPVVLVAGCGQPALAWHLGVVDCLVDAGHRVVTFDNRGVEPSSAPEAPYTIDQMVGDTLGLLDHLGLTGPIRLAGHSMGGWIAEVITERHPDRVAAAAFIGSANVPTAWEKALTTVERDLSRNVEVLTPLHEAVETLRYLPTRQLQDDGVVVGWLAALTEEPVWPNPGRLGQYEACLGWSTGPDRRPAWAEFSIPCLVLAFEHDTDSPPARAREAAAVMPGSRFVEIAGAGHLGIVTHTEAVGGALVDFFGSA